MYYSFYYTNGCLQTHDIKIRLSDSDLHIKALLFIHISQYYPSCIIIYPHFTILLILTQPIWHIAPKLWSAKL
jgi:hypothetical protein